MCGTLYGSLLIFSADSASESNTNNSKSAVKAKNSNDNNKRKSRKLPPKHSKLEFDSKPLAKLKVSNSAIVQVKPDEDDMRLIFVDLCRWTLASPNLPYSSTTPQTQK